MCETEFTDTYAACSHLLGDLHPECGDQAMHAGKEAEA